jgi:parallel beta-helix repeat protein
MKLRTPFAWMLLAAVLSAPLSAAPGSGPVITDGYMAIEEAVAALPRGGGVARLPAGIYLVGRSIGLPGGVTLRGAGPGTVLRKTPGATARLVESAPKGASTVRVDRPERFHRGDQVAIVDDAQVGWNATQAFVVAVEGGRLLLNRGVWASYEPQRHGVVVGLFPLITDSGGERIAVEDLTIEADPQQPPDVWNFTLSALHFNHANRVAVRRVTIRGYPGDGVSIQGGSGCEVRDTVVEGCRGYGFHAGGGLTESVFENNQATGNGADGFFFCANVQAITVRKNRFTGNHGHGIGGLGEDGDTRNVVDGNRCTHNGGAGIVALRGSGNRVMGNICAYNSQEKPGEYPGILLLNTTDTVVQGNDCRAEPGKGTQSWGVLETGSSDRNQITDNRCAGNQLGEVRTVGPHSVFRRLAQ